VFVRICLRALHRGWTGKKLGRISPVRERILDQVQTCGRPAAVKRETEKFLREIHEAQESVVKLFENQKDARAAVTEETEEAKARQRSKLEQENFASEALRIFRVLRPEAPPFYKEDAKLSLEARLNALSLQQTPEGASASSLAGSLGRQDGLQLLSKSSPLQFNLPVVNPTAFVLALQAATSSLAEDLQEFCELLQVPSHTMPEKDDPLRFKKVLDALLNSFALRKDPSYARSWVVRNWARLGPLLPPDLRALPLESVVVWLEGHLERVNRNQQETSNGLPRTARRAESEWYDFGEDFLFDDRPMSPDVLNDREVAGDFPLEKAGEYIQKLFQFSRQGDSPKFSSSSDASVLRLMADQFQQLVDALSRVGLKQWLCMNVKEIEKFLPQGEIPKLQSVSAADRRTAALMLKAAARGKGNLLEFEALDPFQLLNVQQAAQRQGQGQGGEEAMQGVTASVEEELERLAPNPFLSDEDIERLFSIEEAEAVLQGAAGEDKRGIKRAASLSRFEPKDLQEFVQQHDKTPLEHLLEHEEDFYKKAGPAEWRNLHDFADWTWQKPEGTVYDPKTDSYLRESEAADPKLQLGELRQCVLTVSRMLSMTTNGRLYYYRAVVAVGNGRGLFGYGVGFGADPRAARTDGTLKALKRLDLIDLDPGRTMCTPVRGKEYKHVVKIRPRPLGKGITANRKYLPLVYLAGLENVRFKVPYKASRKWLSGMKALRRALDDIQSRRTIAASTGKKYAALVGAGDHWVHWPDKWFQPIKDEFERKWAAVVRERHKKMNSFRSRRGPFVPGEVMGGWTRYTPRTDPRRQEEHRENSRKKHAKFDLSSVRKKAALQSEAQRGSKYTLPPGPVQQKETPR